ncbi:kinase [Amycolatopsis sp. cmx-11-12]|uniref:GHMP family kinase ATP-binding protein n=1 Tax=Amycolatopsis sp. cmx-11-12 TaxID=2785795 RepID=UPI003916F263
MTFRAPAPGSLTTVGVSSVFGTFGELLQGVLPDGRDFLVTFPIARWSTATFRPAARSAGVRVFPAGKRKVRGLAEKMLSGSDAPGGELRLDSSLPEGKGLASSSADLVAAARAIGNALGREVTSAMIEDLLRDIEPTDGVMYRGIVAFHHREVRLRSVLGSLPSLTVVGLDEGGTVDTVAFNRIAKPFGPAERLEYEYLLAKLTAAVRDKDLAAVGEVATRSATMNQVLRPKRTLEQAKDLCERIGGLGVIAAHSGTTVGVLLADDHPGYHRQLAAARHFCLAVSGTVAKYHSLPFGDSSTRRGHR